MSTQARHPGPARTLCPVCSWDIPSPEALKGSSGPFHLAEHAVKHRLAQHRINAMRGLALPRFELEALVTEYAVLVEQYEARCRRLRRDLDDRDDVIDDQNAEVLRLHADLADLQAQVRQ